MQGRTFRRGSLLEWPAFARSLDRFVTSTETEYGVAKKWELGSMQPEYGTGIVA